MDEIVNLVIFVDKNTLAMFNLDIGSVLGFFLVFNVLKYKYHYNPYLFLFCSDKPS